MLVFVFGEIEYEVRVHFGQAKARRGGLIVRTNHQSARFPQINLRRSEATPTNLRGRWSENLNSAILQSLPCPKEARNSERKTECRKARELPVVFWPLLHLKRPISPLAICRMLF